MSNSPLQVTNLVKHYGPVQALKGVSFAVQPGEVFGLLGPNGAGKTSLISIVTTLENPTSGEVHVFGESIAGDSSSVKQKVGWVPQEIINHGYFSTQEILEFHAGYYGVRDAGDRVVELMKQLDLYDHKDKKVRQLSGGMKRRLMIAKALVHKPQLLLLDEPTAGVDVELRSKLWKFVKELRGQGMSILLTTHYLEEAEHLCDRVAIINKGELQAIDSTHELIQKWSRKKVDLRLNKDHSPFTHPDLVRGEGKDWVFMTSQNKPLGTLLGELHLQVNDISDVQMTDGSLEDVFLHFTQKGTL